MQPRSFRENICYLTLSTVDANSLPWCSPVYGVYDQDINLYWGSQVSAQHSINIAQNSNIFVVLYDSTVLPGSGQGVYLNGEAAEVADKDEIENVHKAIRNRRAPIDYWRLDQMHGNSPIRLYKFRPGRLWVNGKGTVNGNYVDTCHEIDIENLKVANLYNWFNNS